MADDFAISVPAWRARRLRAHLAALVETGAASHGQGAGRVPPAELVHRAEIRRWLAGWDRAAAAAIAPKPPTARQLAKIARWQAGKGQLSKASGATRSDILEAVAAELLASTPLARGAIAAAHRETVRRCREAGLPAPTDWRYRKWLKLTGRVV